MATGLARREQWGLIGVIALIALGVGVQGWRRMQPDPPVVYTPGQGRWEKVADFEAGERPKGLLPSPAPSAAGAGSRGGADAQTTTTAAEAGRGEPQSGGLDINRATAAEFERLPGIGPAKARAIVEARSRIGGFDSIERLDAVPGIGAKTLERLRPYLKVEGMARAAAPTNGALASIPVASTFKAKGAGAARAAATMTAATPATEAVRSVTQPATLPVIDVNSAPAEELEKLPGIGPALARRIIEERTARGPFRNPRDLIRVKGIGPRNLEKMLPQVVTGPVKPGR